MRTGAKLVLAVLVTFSCASARAADELADRLDAALAAPALGGARIGALVVSADGVTRYARHPDRRLVPASNQKILTALAVLSAFGPAHRFTTAVSSDAPLDASGAVDTLMIRGGGDPALTSESYWRLAADLRGLGLRSVRKGLWLDGSAFDSVRWHPSWGATTARAYHAPLSGLTANYGAFSVSVHPGSEKGDAASVAVDPPVTFLSVSNRARTGPRFGAPKLAVERNGAGAVEHVVVSGTVPVGHEPQIVYRSVLDPVRYAGAVLRMQLEANGVSVGDAVTVAPVPAESHSLLSFEGRPLAETVRLFMKFSNNVIAEGLVKALGARGGAGPGSWDSGMAALRSELTGLGVDASKLTLVDGSGLSTENRVTAAALVAALRVARNSFAFGPEFVASLPIAAADGTLEKRAGGAANVVRAKTGLLTRVSSLSGYAQPADGPPFVFSVMTNGYRGSAEGAMAALDRFATVLVQERAAGPSSP